MQHQQGLSPQSNTPHNTEQFYLNQNLIVNDNQQPISRVQTCFNTIYQENGFIRLTDYLSPPPSSQSILSSNIGWILFYIVLNIINLEKYLSHIHVTVPNLNQQINDIANQLFNHESIAHLANHSIHNHTTPSADDIFSNTLAYDQQGNFTIWSIAILTFLTFSITKLSLMCGNKAYNCIHKTNSETSFSDILINKVLNFASNHVLAAITLYSTSSTNTNTQTYLNQTLEILKKDSQTAFFHDNFFVNEKIRPPLCYPILQYTIHPSIYEFYDVSHCSNLIQTRTRAAFGYLYLPTFYNLIRYYSLYKMITASLFLSYKITSKLFAYWTSSHAKEFEKWSYRYLNDAEGTLTADAMKDYNKKQTFLLRYQKLKFDMNSPEQKNRTRHHSSFCQKIVCTLIQIIQDATRYFSSISNITIAIIAGITLYFLFTRFFYMQKNNETCNNPAEWQWFDDCIGLSATFQLLNQSHAIRFVSKSIHHLDTNNIFPLLNVNNSFVSKSAYLININKPHINLDLLLSEETPAKNSNKITLLSSNAGVEIEKLIGSSILLMLITYSFSIIGSLCNTLYTAICPKLKKYFQQTQFHQISTTFWKRLEFSFSNSISFATSINSYFYMGLLLSVGLMSGIRESGANWNEFDFLSHLISTILYDISPSHIKNNTALFNQTENDNSIIYEISGGAQLYVYSGILFAFPILILTCGLRNFTCKLGCGVHTQKLSKSLSQRDYHRLASPPPLSKTRELFISGSYSPERKEQLPNGDELSISRLNI